MNIPIVLYNLNKEIFNTYNIVKSNCIYFYSYQNFNVQIISGTGTLFSVKQLVGPGNVNYLDTQEGQSFQNNFGYTLFIPDNKSKIIIEVSTLNESKNFSFYLEYDNVINETNEHYNDLLINYYLPTYSELEKCIPDEFEHANLLKRLLLDFKNILRLKGTKNSIEKTLNFLGFNHENLTIYDEFLNRKTNTVTLVPDKTKDIKTGKYQVTYDNFQHVGVDENNLPIRNIIIHDLSKFTEHMLNAIALINIYFTCEEQEIVLFSLKYSSNSPSWLTTYSSMNMIFENDVFDFRKKCHINLDTYFSSKLKTIVVDNCLQKVDTIFKSESKYYLNDFSLKTNSEIYYCDYEIFDDILLENIDLTKIERIFGNIIHLKIQAPNNFIEFELIDLNNPFSKLDFSKEFVFDFIDKTIVLIKTSSYQLKIKITDNYNNIETYIYNFSINVNIQQIDFETFNSTRLKYDENKNNIILDVDSQNETIIIPEPIEDSKSFIISPISSIPNDMLTYFDIQTTNMFKWLTESKRYIIPAINKNFPLNSITETIPLELFDNWLNIISFEYNIDWELKLRIYDKELCQKILIDYHDISNYDVIFDKLYIVIMDIYDRLPNGTINTNLKPYYFITTTESGIDVNDTTFDFVLVNSVTTEVKSIYSLITNTEIFKIKIPINHDFQLFEILSNLVPTILPYISNQTYKEDYIVQSGETKNLVTIKSIFTRLTNVSEDQYNLSYSLKIFDIIFCRLNDIYVVNSTDIVWKIFNSFTNELLFESKSYSLKYQITENICYDVLCEFKVNGTSYNIFKKSLFSSFVSLEQTNNILSSAITSDSTLITSDSTLITSDSF